MTFTNCHVHTFTHEHTPRDFVRWPFGRLLAVGWIRRAVLRVVHLFDRGRRSTIARYAQILEVSFRRSQQDVFEIVKALYPPGTRFVVLPMDMELMGVGPVAKPIGEQHDTLGKLRDRYPDEVIPFAAADPRRADVVERTVRWIEDHGFRGIKLYPRLGFHPDDRALEPLYVYAARHGIPVLTHCSRTGPQFRGEPTARMRTDPQTGNQLELDRLGLLDLFTAPEACAPILARHPGLKLCLAHFGGAEEWDKYIADPSSESWLATILAMIRGGSYPGLYTDISFTLFVKDDYINVLRTLLEDSTVASRVLFGSDFYVVDRAQLEEESRVTQIRAVLGDELFETIAVANPEAFLTRA
jgi:uncharacterized protein